MTDLTASLTDIWGQRKRIDWPWALIPIILAAIAILSPPDALPIAEKMLSSLAHTAPFILFAISATAYLRDRPWPRSRTG